MELFSVNLKVILKTDSEFYPRVVIRDSSTERVLRIPPTEAFKIAMDINNSITAGNSVIYGYAGLLSEYSKNKGFGSSNKKVEANVKNLETLMNTSPFNKGTNVQFLIKNNKQESDIIIKFMIGQQEYITTNELLSDFGNKLLLVAIEGLKMEYAIEKLEQELMLPDEVFLAITGEDLEDYLREDDEEEQD